MVVIRHGFGDSVSSVFKRFFDLNEVAWRKFQHNTTSVFVKDLSNKEFDEHFNISLFKVAYRGEFPKHHHKHSHVIYFLSGVGEFWVGSRIYKAKPGTVALVRSNEEHGYRNTGKEDLKLIVSNSPATR